jgi:hypothetical protein
MEQTVSKDRKEQKRCKERKSCKERKEHTEAAHVVVGTNA